MINKKFTLLLLLFSITSLVFSQNALVERYLTAANNSYNQKDYAKAFDYINYVFGQYTPENIPQNVEILAETIYYDYLEEIRNNKDTTAFAKVKSKLLEYPTLSSERVNRMVRTMNTIETQDNSWGSAGDSTYTSRESVEYKAQLEKTKAELAAVERALTEAKELNHKEQEESLLREQQLLQSQKELYETAMIKTTRHMNSSTIVILLIALCLIGIVIGGVILILSITKKSEQIAQKQQEQFEATLQMVAQLTRNQKETIGITQIPDIYNSEFSQQSIAAPIGQLPESELTEAEHQALKKLATKCEEVGARIDTYTGRKNNSKNVAEMVFKIAHGLKLGSYESMLYLCASMVYDIGFLGIDTNLLMTEHLSDEQKYIIRGHVKLGINKIDFVPEKYRKVFVDAILTHHENMDGSGYPKGMLGESIPQIGRVIHVVESFIALISRRNYHGIFDKESAIKELKGRPNLYDMKIVDILDSLV